MQAEGGPQILPFLAEAVQALLWWPRPAAEIACVACKMK